MARLCEAKMDRRVQCHQWCVGGVGGFAGAALAFESASVADDK